MSVLPQFESCADLGRVLVRDGPLDWAPAAAGSGVPEVMAYLNGCNIPKAWRCRLTPE